MRDLTAPDLSQVPFGPAEALVRLARLKQLCQETGVEALLFINGVDGKNNNGARKALAWLLSGASGTDVENAGRGDETLEDVMLLISEHTCSVYCNPKNFGPLSKLMGTWPGIQISRLPDHITDADAEEEFKILSFFEFVKPFSNFGIPLTPKSDGAQAMEIEMWPVVQAYGIQELGAQGFFSMVNKITDITTPLEAVFAEMDASSLRHCVYRSLPLLRFQWDSALALVDKTPAEERRGLAGSTIAEPLASFFSHGLLRLPPSERREAERSAPRATMGGLLPSDPALPGPPLHFIMSASEPRGPLQLVRTMFLSNGGPAAGLCPTFVDDEDAELDVGDGDSPPKHSSQWEKAALSRLAQQRSKEIPTLLRLYSSLTKLFDRVAKHLATHPDDTAGLEAQVVSLLEAAISSDACLSPLLSFDLKANVKVECGWSDALGVATPAAIGKGVGHITVTVLNVPYKLGEHSVSGAIAYGDCFVAAKTSDGESRVRVLTKDISAHVAWANSEMEVDGSTGDEWRPTCEAVLRRLTASAKHAFSRMGHLVPGHGRWAAKLTAIAGTASGDVNGPVWEGELWALDNGFIFLDPRLGYSVVEFGRDIDAVRVHNLDAVHMDTAALAPALLMKTKDDFVFHGYVEVLTSGRESGKQGSPLVLALSPVGDEHEQKMFARVVVPPWRNAWIDKNINVSDTSLPVDIFQPPRPLVDDTFASDFDRTHGGRFVEPAAPSGRRVSVLMGCPGIDLDRLASHIMQLTNPTEFSLAVVPFDYSTGAACLDESAVSDILRRSGDTPRVILAITTYADAAAIAGVVFRTNHVVESITAVVSAIEFYRGRSWPTSVVARQCAAGFTSSVILTNADAVNEGILSLMRSTLHLVNPTSHVGAAKGGIVAEQDDLQSILHPDPTSLFSSPACLELRHKSGERWWHATPGGGGGGISSLRCSAGSDGHVRLDRQRLTDALSLLLKKGSTHGDLAAFVDQRKRGGADPVVWHVAGQVAVCGEEGEEAWVELNGTASHLRLDPVPPTAPPHWFICFVGLHLTPSLVDSVLNARVKLPELIPLRTPESLSRQEKEMLKRQHMNAPLPDGVFFDGASYVDFSGTVSPFHPDMDKFVRDYIDAENQELRRHNATAEAEIATATRHEEALRKSCAR